MKTRLNSVLNIVFNLVFSVALLAGVSAMTYYKGARSGTQEVLGKIQELTAQGRVVTSVEVRDKGVLELEYSLLHRPRPFYFPDDKGAGLGKR